jgi:ribonuclease HI
MLEVYVDGAYSPLRNQGGWAYVITENDQKITSDLDVVLNTTNNRMEIQAVIEALKYIQENNIVEATIYSDSMYVVEVMNKDWKKNKNKDLWSEIEELIKNKKIKWVHVKGHSGNKFNEMCDMLAVHGSKLIINE